MEGSARGEGGVGKGGAEFELGFGLGEGKEYED